MNGLDRFERLMWLLIIGVGWPLAGAGLAFGLGLGGKGQLLFALVFFCIAWRLRKP